jgi:hypothetical protein
MELECLGQCRGQQFRVSDLDGNDDLRMCLQRLFHGGQRQAQLVHQQGRAAEQIPG